MVRGEGFSRKDFFIFFLNPRSATTQEPLDPYLSRLEMDSPAPYRPLGRSER